MSAEAKFNGSILILGSSGKVGVPTVNTLIAQKVPNVHLLVRDEEKTKKALGLAADAPVKFVKGDLYDLPSVEAALKGVERVFLIHPSGDQKNIEAVAKLAKAANVKLFLHLSVLGANPAAPKNTIQYNHAKGEDAVDAAGVPYVFLRPPYFFQNWLNEAASIKHGTIYRPELKYAVSNIDTRDIADAAVTILTAADLSKHIGRTYFLNTDALTYEGIARTISTAIGKEVKLVTVGDADWYGALQQHGLPELYAWLLLKLHQQSRAAPIDNVFGDFKLLTGKEPRKLADFFAENKAAFL